MNRDNNNQLGNSQADTEMVMGVLFVIGRREHEGGVWFGRMFNQTFKTHSIGIDLSILPRQNVFLQVIAVAAEPSSWVQYATVDAEVGAARFVLPCDPSTMSASEINWRGGWRSARDWRSLRLLRGFACLRRRILPLLCCAAEVAAYTSSDMILG